MRLVGIAGAAVGEFRVPFHPPSPRLWLVICKLQPREKFVGKKSKKKLLGSREFGRDLHSQPFGDISPKATGELPPLV